MEDHKGNNLLTTTTNPGSTNVASIASPLTMEQGLLFLGLGQYIDRCKEAGINNWATLSQLSEAGFEAIGVSLGHRRKLQRAFAQRHYWPGCLPLPTADEIRAFPGFPFEAESSSSGSDESISPQPSEKQRRSEVVSDSKRTTSDTGLRDLRQRNWTGQIEELEISSPRSPL
ncbi:hypothetical protein BJ878DRAFT_9840 [Calycina marina]|uniref:SAM domain-containing protein n=1 Tax=Calycina marina TaxID=1763456 RepID=A0A9P7Z654_9HELO|nr:hypothetical protein BJ878DRAFT_9840 [Calycina marina]